MSTPAVLKGRLARGLVQLGQGDLPAISSTTQDQLIEFVMLLAKWNRVYNLTAVRDLIQMVDRHLLDSLVIRRWLPESVRSDGKGVPGDVMDIGTGAGLPVLPLAMIRPDLQFLSIESNGKKTRFQQQAVLELGIPNVTVVQQRVQEVTAQARLVLSRAFTGPEEFLKIAQPLCVSGGMVAIMLGHAEKFPAEVKPAYELLELVKMHVPGTDSARHVAVCRRQAG